MILSIWCSRGPNCFVVEAMEHWIDRMGGASRLCWMRFKVNGTVAAFGLTGVALGALAFSKAARKVTGNSHVPQPSKTVDLQLYLGKWYELARYENRFERGCEAVTAEYGLRPDGTITVRNACRKGGVAGPVRAAHATARIVPGSGNAKLKLAFFGPFFFGNYWVLDHAEDYSWSIVGEPSGQYLWILGRDPNPPETHQRGVIARAAQLGYDTTLIRRTAQP